MNEENDPTGKARGGFARAEVLSAEKRVEIAREAARIRWASASVLPKVTHTGILEIGDAQIPCAVLSDGTRLLTQEGFLGALGRSTKPKGRSQQVTDGLPPFLATKSLTSLISKDIIDSTVPVTFVTPKGGKALGFKAHLLPQVCDLFLQARSEGLLTTQQLPIADKCEILIRALAKVGIVALVDEATGYQEERGKQALQAILDAFLRKELAAWAKRFPDEFYEQIFRLRGWQWKGRGTNPPQAVAGYTKDIVYARLAPGIIEELERKNPSEHGKRRAKHHQWLTEDVGHPALAQHVHAVITLMRISTSWDQFRLFLDQAHPKRGDTMQLPLMIDVPLPAKPIEKLPLFGQSLDASQAS